MSLRQERGGRDELTLRLLVVPSDRSRKGRERVADFLAQFLAGLVQTDDWTPFAVGKSLDLLMNL